MNDEVMLHGELIRMQKDLLDAVDAKQKAEAELAKQDEDYNQVLYKLQQAEAELAEAHEIIEGFRKDTNVMLSKWADVEAERDRLEKQYKSLFDKSSALINENGKLREALMLMVDHFGGPCERDCPMDDTCNCSKTKQVNDALKGTRVTLGD